MTSKEFVLSIYPKASFSHGIIFEGECDRIIWYDEYGTWSKEWIDPPAIEYAWDQAAECVNYKILRKLTE